MGRWIAEVPAIPGALCYGRTQKEALAAIATLTLRILADRIEHGDRPSDASPY